MRRLFRRLLIFFRYPVFRVDLSRQQLNRRDYERTRSASFWES